MSVCVYYLLFRSCLIIDDHFDVICFHVPRYHYLSVCLVNTNTAEYSYYNQTFNIIVCQWIKLSKKFNFLLIVIVTVFLIYLSSLNLLRCIKLSMGTVFFITTTTRTATTINIDEYRLIILTKLDQPTANTDVETRT